MTEVNIVLTNRKTINQITIQNDCGCEDLFCLCLLFCICAVVLIVDQCTGGLS